MGGRWGGGSIWIEPQLSRDTGPSLSLNAVVPNKEKKAQKKSKQEAIQKVSEGPLGSIDPHIPVDIGDTLKELEKEDEILLTAWKHDAINVWKNSMDKATLFGK